MLPNVFKLGIQEDPEIKALIEESANKLNEHIQKRQAEREAAAKAKSEKNMETAKRVLQGKTAVEEKLEKKEEI